MLNLYEILFIFVNMTAGRALLSKNGIAISFASGGIAYQRVMRCVCNQFIIQCLGRSCPRKLSLIVVLASSSAAHKGISVGGHTFNIDDVSGFASFATGSYRGLKIYGDVLTAQQFGNVAIGGIKSQRTIFGFGGNLTRNLITSGGCVFVVGALFSDSKTTIFRDGNIAYRILTSMRSFSKSKRGNLQETDTHGQDQDQRLQTFGRVLHDTFSSLFLKFSQ